jgi:hypothetical protein
MNIITAHHLLSWGGAGLVLTSGLCDVFLVCRQPGVRFAHLSIGTAFSVLIRFVIILLDILLMKISISRSTPQTVPPSVRGF